MKTNRDRVTRILMTAAILASILLPLSATARELSVNEQLLRAAEDGSLDGIKASLAKGGDINAKNREGLTVLMAAACRKNLEVVKFLVDHGADVNAKDERGNMALMFADQWNNPEVAKLLINSGLDVRAKNETGETILVYAALTGNLEVVKLLLQKGLDMNAKNGFDGTVLMSAAEGIRPGVVKFLIDSRADVNAKDLNGETALMKAINWKRYFYFCQILETGCPEALTKDQYGRTLEQRSFEVVKLLVNGGADVNAKNEIGDTALSLASYRKQPEIVQYLKAHGAKSSKRKSKTP